MPILRRRRQPWDETLPNGQRVDEAVAALSRNPWPPPRRRLVLPPVAPIEQSAIPEPEITPIMRQPVPVPSVAEIGPPPIVPVLTRNPVSEPTVPLPTWNPGEVLDYSPEPIRRQLVPVDENVSVGYAPPPVLAPFNRPPVMFGGRDGLPERVVAEGSSLDRAMLKRGALEDYQPKKESKKHLLARTLLNFIGGGIPGAAGTLIGPGGIMDRRGLDRSRQQQELARTDQGIGRELLMRKTTNDLLNDESQRRYRQAQTTRLGREPQRNVQTGSAVLPDGRTVQMEHDGKAWKMSTGPDGQPIITKPAPVDKPKVKVNVPGVGELEVRPESALGYYGAVSGREESREQRQEERTRKDEEISAEAQSLLEQSQSARSIADELDKQLRGSGGLYEQRTKIQTELGAEGPIDPSGPERIAHNTRMSQLAALNSRIAQIEQGRNSHYANADKLRGQATKFKPARGQRGGSPPGRGRNYVAPKVSAQRLQELMQ
jgi:hypothetical protein